MGVLGQKVEGKFTYDPSFLEREERKTNRESIEIASVQPFFGFDIWNCYEFSFLNENGVPKNYVLKIMYPASSRYIVESKSLKLYLNSFNMQTFQKDINGVVEVIKSDLSKFLECEVLVKAFDPTENECIGSYQECSPKFLENYISKDLKCEVYTRTPELLEDADIDPKPKFFLVKSCSLRSNCKVTGQPDWGDIWIYMEGKRYPDADSLFKYIVSYRDEHHFHEEVVEMIYMDLLKKFEPEKLLVLAKYTRRGGIDINPIRVSEPALLNLFSNLIEKDIPNAKTFRQ